MPDTIVSHAGNLVAAPELKFLPNGTAVATFTVANTPRIYNKNSQQWEDGDTLFLRCNAWKHLAENVAESLDKGMRVLVTGKLKQRSWEKDGQKRTSIELEVEEVGPSLKAATAKVTKVGGTGFNTHQDDNAPF